MKDSLPEVFVSSADDKNQPIKLALFPVTPPPVKNPFLVSFELRPVERFLGMTRPRLFGSSSEDVEYKLNGLLAVYSVEQAPDVCLKALLKIELLATRLARDDLVKICHQESERIRAACQYQGDDNQWEFMQAYAADLDTEALPDLQEIDFSNTIESLTEILLAKKNSKLQKTIIASLVAEIASEYDQLLSCQRDNLINLTIIWCGLGYQKYASLLDVLIRLLYDVSISTKLDDALWEMIEQVSKEMRFMRILLDRNHNSQQGEIVIAYKDSTRFMQSMLADSDYLDRLYLFELLYKLECALVAELGEDEDWLANLQYIFQSAINSQIEGYYDDEVPECLQPLCELCAEFSEEFDRLGPMGRYEQACLERLEARIKELRQANNQFHTSGQTFTVKLLGGAENLVYLLTPSDLPDQGVVLRLEKHPREPENSLAVAKVSELFPDFIGRTFLNNTLPGEVYHACSYGQYFSGGTLESYLMHLHALRPNGLLIEDKLLLLERFGFMLKKLGRLHEEFISFPDIKPSNLFLVDAKSPDIAVSDVKSLYQFPSDTLLTYRQCGSLDYVAPEVGLGRLGYDQYNPFAADFYALGRTFEYYLLGDVKKRCKSDCSPSCDIDYQLSRLIQQLTCEDPQQRLRYAWDMLTYFDDMFEEVELSCPRSSPVRTRSLENKKTPEVEVPQLSAES